MFARAAVTSSWSILMAVTRLYQCTVGATSDEGYYAKSMRDAELTLDDILER